MGGPNLEIFKFGMYIMFPIGWMYYFGTNLDNKFSVKDFWPSKEQLNKIPTERDDIAQEVERMKKQRLRKREARLAEQKFEEDDASSMGRPVSSVLNDRSLGGPLDQFANSGSDREGKSKEMKKEEGEQSRKKDSLESASPT